MISITTLKLNKLCLVLVVGLHLAFVDAFPPREPNITLEEHKIINSKIEFLKLSQKGCSQAVFVYDHKKPNCTISIWYTGAFHLWMLRNAIVMDLKKATVQELRTIPFQMCTCKKVHVSDLCPADAHNVTDNLLHSCKDFIETSTGVPMGGVVAGLIKMVNDVKKLENISVSLDYTTKINLNVGENDHLMTLGSLNGEIDAPWNKYTTKETAEDKSNVKNGLKDDYDNKNSIDKFNGKDTLKKYMKLGSKDIDSKGVKKEEGATTERHEVGETNDITDNDANEAMKYDDSKQNNPQIDANSTEYEVKSEEINLNRSKNVTEVEEKEGLDDDKRTEDDLTKGEESKKGEDRGDKQETDNDEETKGEIKDLIIKHKDNDKEKEEFGATEETDKMEERTTREIPSGEHEDSESENSDEDNDDDDNDKYDNDDDDNDDDDNDDDDNDDDLTSF